MVLLSGNDGEKKGIVILRMDPEKYLFPVLRYTSMKLSSLRTILMRKDGNRIEVLSPLVIGGKAVREYQVENINSIEVLAAFGKRGYIEGVDQNGTDVVAYSIAIPSTDWVILSRVDESEAFADLGVLRWTLTGLSIVVLLIALATTFLITGVKEKNIIRDLETNELRLKKA